MAELLKAVIQFPNVAAGASESKPHGLNLGGIHGGRAEVPDHLEVNNGDFSATADSVNVTVTNTSGAVASVDVLVEMWHSIPRAFGASEGKDVQDSLAVRPFIPASGGGTTLDEKVKVSGADTTPGYLTDKLVAGSGVALAVLSPGADEDAEISVFGADADNIVTAAPITVTGPTNSAGVGSAMAKAAHQHRLELRVEDEAALAGNRPTLNFVGLGVGAVDDPGNDRVNVTIPGNVTDGASVVRSEYVDSGSSTSGNVFVDGMAGASVVVPIDGDYWAIWEGESEQSNANATLEVGISVNSVVAIVANSERIKKASASDFATFVTTVHLGSLLTGDLVRGLFRKVSGSGSVSLNNRNLTIFKVQ